MAGTRGHPYSARLDPGVSALRVTWEVFVRSPIGPALLLVLLSFEVSHAASVSGSFVESGSRTPLAAVEVVLRRAADSTVVAHASTGADGRFRLGGLRAERLLLRASLLGHDTYVRRDLAPSESAPDLDLGTITLVVSPIPIPGATVNEARATAIIAPDRNVYLTKDMPSARAAPRPRCCCGSRTDVDINGNGGPRDVQPTTRRPLGASPATPARCRLHERVEGSRILGVSIPRARRGS
jgi:hypothetical protein